MNKHDALQPETTLSDDALAHVVGGAQGPVLVKPQGPIFPNVTFDYPKRPINPRDIR